MYFVTDHITNRVLIVCHQSYKRIPMLWNHVDWLVQAPERDGHMLSYILSRSLLSSRQTGNPDFCCALESYNMWSNMMVISVLVLFRAHVVHT